MALDIIEQLRGVSAAHREAAERIFVELVDRHDETLIETLAVLLKDERPNIRAAALDIMTESGDIGDHPWEQNVKALALLSDGDPRVRESALKLARQTAEATSHPSILENLIHCIADSSSKNRDAAIDILLNELGGELDSDHYFLLGEYLSHRRKVTRDAAREILSAKGQDDLIITLDASVMDADANYT